MKNTTTPGVGPDATKAAEGPNGLPGQQTTGTGAEDARRESMQRAEELVDRWAEQLGRQAAAFGHGILKLAARAREEAEDILAEAQAIRERQQSAGEQPEGRPPAKG